MVNVKKHITTAQKSILEELTTKARTVKQIAKKRRVSQQAIYAQLKIMVRKGWLKKDYTPNYRRVK